MKNNTAEFHMPHE